MISAQDNTRDIYCMISKRMREMMRLVTHQLAAVLTEENILVAVK